MRIRDYKKQLIIIAVFLFCLLAVWLYPLKAVNVTIQMNFSGAENGSTVEWLVEQDGQQEVASRTTVFSQQAQFRLDPAYYEVDSIELRIFDVKQSPVLEKITVYSGEYDTSSDPIIAQCSVETIFQLQNNGSYSLQLSQEVLDQLDGSLHQNLVIRWVLTGVFTIAFILTLLLMSKYRKKTWNQFLRYGLIIISGIVLVYLLFYTDFYREPSANATKLAVPVEEVTENSETDSESTVQSQGIPCETVIAQHFLATQDQMQLIRVYFQFSPSEITQSIETEEEIVGEIGICLLDSSSEVVASGVFSTDRIRIRGYAELKLPNSKEITAGNAYTIEIEPLSKVFPEDLQVSVEPSAVVEGQSLSANDQVITDSALKCDVDYANTSPIPQLRVGILIFLLILLIFTVSYRKLHLKPEMAIILIYAAIFVYSIQQIWFYMQHVGNTPDETAHISYIAYLVQTGRVVPNFSEMQLLSFSGNTASFVEGTLNQLGHPPLYYLTMMLCNPIEVIGDNLFLVHITRLRLFSAGFGLVAIAIAFYIGYTRITKKQPALHLLYGAVITSVPMFLFNLSGVNNDTFSLLGCVLFFLGILRICEEKRNVASYILIAIGLMIALLSKVTSGMLIGLAAIIYVIWYCIKHKSVKLIFCKEFLFTLPIYLLAAAYFVIVYLKFHTLQPDLSSINPEYYQMSGFYTDFANRATMSMLDYFLYYWENFFGSWTAIASHVSLFKPSNWISYDRIFTILILFAPILLLFLNKARKYVVMLIGFYVSLVIVVLMQFQRAFNTFYYVAGYLGGHQSRYYLCVLPILAFIAVYLLHILVEREKQPKQSLENKHQGMIVLSPPRIAVIISVVCSIFLFYSGFVYFLFNYFGY